MKNLFISLINLSIYGSYFIVFVLMIRWFVQQFPKRYLYALWVMVFAKLCIPFSLKSIFSWNNLSQNVILPDNFSTMEKIPAQARLNEVPSISLAPENPSLTQNAPTFDWANVGMNFLMVLWLIGIFFLLAHSIYSLYRLKKELRCAKHLEENIYLSDTLTSAFVFGIRPKIYIPSNLSEEKIEYIITHERIHIARKDYLIKFFCWIVLCIHWMNPLVWLAFHYMVEDMEISCDEKVLDLLGYENKKSYSNTLLELASKHSFFETRVAFGENSTKKRIHSVLDYRKPRVWTVLTAIVLVLFAGAFFFSEKIADPNQKIKELYEYKTPYVGDNSKVGNIIYRLYIPFEYSEHHFEILSKEKPYGLKIFYTVDSSTPKYNPFDFDYDNNAMVLFSLIDNLDRIEFHLKSKEYAVRIFTREDMDKKLARYSNESYPHTLKESGQSLENFKLLYETLGFSWLNTDIEKQTLIHLKKLEEVTNKYLPDIMNEDLDMIDYEITTPLRTFDEELLYRYVPSENAEEGNLLKCETVFKQGKLIWYHIKSYGYFDKLPKDNTGKIMRGYYAYITDGDIASLKDVPFNWGTDEDPSIHYLNVEQAEKYKNVFQNENPKDKNTDLIHFKKLSDEEGLAIANEFVQEFVDKNIVLNKKIANDNSYGDYYTDKDEKYQVHVNLDLGFVQTFRSYHHDYPFLQDSK